MDKAAQQYLIEWASVNEQIIKANIYSKYVKATRTKHVRRKKHIL